MFVHSGKMVGNFCSDVFWDTNAIWNSTVPDFSTCFEDTLLVFIPCLVFSIIGIFNLYFLSRYVPVNPLPFTWRIIFKQISVVLLCIISATWCFLFFFEETDYENKSISTLIALFARPITYVIIIILMIKHRNHGITTSTVLSLFWICFAVTGAVIHRSVILKYDSQNIPFNWNYTLCNIYYTLIYIELIMSFFVDTRNFDHLEVGSPLEEEALFSGVTYVWFTRIVYRGVKRLLTVKDFLPLAVKLKSTYAYEVFSKHWKFHLQPSDLQKQNLSWALLKSFWPWLIIGFILEMIYVFLLLVPPLILDGILEFVNNDFYSWRSYFYCASIFISSVVSKTLQNNFVMYLLLVNSQVKSALISAIFRKNLLLASSKRKDFSSGAITNLVSVDVNRISEFALYATSLVSAPFRIILVLALMWQYLGPSCLAGLAVIVILIPISFFMTRISEKYSDQQMEVKDKRLKYMNEILQGIKILKFYAWEIPFSSKISKTRKEEIKFIRLSQMCYVITNFVYACAPILVSVASFTTFLLIDKKHVLDPARAFVSLNLLDQLRFALFVVPDSLSELIQTITALDRIKAFLISEEIDPAVVGCNPEEGNVITVKNASLYWSEETSFKLENIDLNISDRSLVAVIGPVGSGKSSLLSAFLGEMYKTSGSIDVKGNLAYVPQEAWILNRSLKCNILLEKPINEGVYSKILDCCCLRPDLKILPAGDGTEIGEKGINLSGGQKQRISLARAVFQNRDIYLLDDPLSAVDAHVRKALFEDVIGNQGLLKNKTRVLVTHDISVLPYVDVIIRMEEGKILERGTYEQLLESSETFQNFIRTHSGQVENDSLDLGEKILSKEAVDIQKKTYSRAISDDFVKPSAVKQSDATLIDEEKMEEGGVKRGIYLNYIKHIGWPMLLLALLGYVAYTALETGANIWVADWTSDPVLNRTHDNSRTVWRLSVYGGLGAAQALTIVMGVACMVYGSTKASELYHNQMLDSILKSPMSFFDVTPMGRIVNRFSTDMDTLDIHLVYDIDGWINCVLYSICTFLLIGINTPIFLASVIPLALLYYVFLKLHLNTSRQIMRLQSTTRSPIYSHLLESIYGVSCIKAFKVENEFTEKLEENVDSHIACCFNAYACNRWLHFWLDFIGSVVVLVATLLAILNRNNLGPSLVGLIITYALSVTDALMWLVRTNTELENKSVAVERVHEYCLLKPEAPWSKPENDPAITWPESGEIVFDNYSTRYRENLDLVLKDVNMNIHSNEKVGIVGRTGAGKSSVTLALFRIIEPAEGTILIDNVDLSKIGLHALRSKLTIIPQDPVLFTGSLRFNLDPNDEYNDDDIWKSLENSHLKDFVSGLSEGLQHTIDEGGGNLSAGQKQLLCLSRALLKKSKILVLDEATAAVDMDTDSLVQETIKSAFADHTVITIAHRLNTVLDYDKIIVMDTGSVIEVGNPGDLLQNKNSHFYKMARDAGLV